MGCDQFRGSVFAVGCGRVFHGCAQERHERTGNRIFQCLLIAFALPENMFTGILCSLQSLAAWGSLIKVGHLGFDFAAFSSCQCFTARGSPTRIWSTASLPVVTFAFVQNMMRYAGGGIGHILPRTVLNEWSSLLFYAEF